MTKDTLFVAVDVEEKEVHEATVVRKTGELFELRCKPNGGALRKKLPELLGTRCLSH